MISNYIFYTIIRKIDVLYTRHTHFLVKDINNNCILSTNIFGVQKRDTKLEI